eukprot:CAMPEP_0116552128 /NCGR_PEP_ID=MMETSP0397-20121206/6321_1 /TAXON_ID=216820 /ORGANISM="Cyclophora tenuis, Strain ECT3854" /LENGTH=66 /DNA_ID=CAMNT_0004077057 /DNA_START=305 /DNA_END=502 /DNA_ORIENTATION=+
MNELFPLFDDDSTATMSEGTSMKVSRLNPSQSNLRRRLMTTGVRAGDGAPRREVSDCIEMSTRSKW